MIIRIDVRYRTNNHGAGQLRAQGRGHIAARRMVTIPYPHELHNDEKRHEAAAQLERKLERDNGWHLRLIAHAIEDNGPQPRLDVFSYEVFDQTVPPFANRKALLTDTMPAGYAT